MLRMAERRRRSNRLAAAEDRLPAAATAAHAEPSPLPVAEGDAGAGTAAGPAAEPPAAPGPRRHRVLMACDFFFPNIGGIETHILQLSQRLLARGHKVVVFTHAYGEQCGVRWLAGGLKVYYAPRVPVISQATPPTIFGGFALLRAVLLRERISLVHAHGAFSAIAHEAIIHARTMGYKVVFTDHSLFGFADVASILMNKVLKFSLADCHAVICVSHTSKENTVLRACLPPSRVAVIPNAVDASAFQPDLSRPRGGVDGRVTVVALSRLVYRKGVDLLNVVIPAVCRRQPHVDFIIGGDGPMAGLLRATVRREGLDSRVRMLGAVPSDRVRDVLVQGDIFINASLTEAFCCAIIEAASVGLLVVSTAVGGVPEVLPSELLLLAEPSPAALAAELERALTLLHTVDAERQHKQVAGMYSWERVAVRTEWVYDAVADSRRDDTFLARLQRLYKCGSWFGKICCCIAALDDMYWRWLQWWRPDSSFERAPDHPVCCRA